MAFAVVSVLPMTAAAADGTLLIEVSAGYTSDLDRDPGPGFGGSTASFWVQNLATGKSYGGKLTNTNLAMLDLPEGKYCLDVVKVVGNVTAWYCHEPFIQVDGGTMTNAGRWRLGFLLRDRSFRLFGGFEDAEAVLARARKQFPERFAIDVAQ